jgi:hypothetical protein
MPGLTKDELMDAQDVLDDHDGWVPQGLNWAARNGGSAFADNPSLPASKDVKTTGKKTADANTERVESDDVDR